MPTAWRIVRQQHAKSAFSGDGASRFGGRWNSRGVAVVYASSTQSLAALETLVHLTPATRFRYKVFTITFDESLVETMPLNRLSRDWKTQPVPRSTQRLGDAWVRAGRSPILRVPSVLVPGESNLVLNPNHSDFSRVIIGKPVSFVFDPRLL